MASTDTITCQICLKRFHEPRMLPCGHSFCRCCLQLICDACNQLMCPVCNKLYLIPNGDAGNLQRNFLLETLLEGNAPATEMCEKHADKCSELFCDYCAKAFCTKCLALHKTHDVIDYADRREQLVAQVASVKNKIKDLEENVTETSRIAEDRLEIESVKIKAVVKGLISQTENMMELLKAVKVSLVKISEEAERVVYKALQFERFFELRKSTNDLRQCLGDVLKLSRLTEQTTKLKLLEETLEVTEGEFGKLLEHSPVIPEFKPDSSLLQELSSLIAHARQLKDDMYNSKYKFTSLETEPTPTKESEEQPVCETTTSTADSNTKQLLLVTADSQVYAYDPVASKWLNVAPMSQARFCTAATLLNGKLVVASNCNFDGNRMFVDQYDPEANSWSSLPNMINFRQCLVLVAFDEQLFAIGGWFDKSCLNSVEKFDAKTKQWTFDQSIKTPRQAHCGTVVKSGIVIAAGLSALVASSALKSAEKYDGARREWKQIADLQIARYYASAASVSDQVYVFGGRDELSKCLDSAEQYDDVANTWTLIESKLSVPKSHTAAASVDAHIYVVGGHDEQGPASSVDRFDVTDRRISCVESLPHAALGTAAVSVPVSVDAFNRLVNFS